jgi:outer membrane protein OmpU
MKRLLLASSIIAASTGFAAAEIAMSGSARMGIIDNFADDSLGFTMRIRVNFDMSGETDGGLTFGASVRADNSDEANDTGTAGSVFISGALGKLSMGDVDGAAGAAMGQVDGVGLTGLGDLNEIIFIGNGGTDEIVFDAGFSGPITGDPSALYEYSAGALTFYLGVNSPNFAWAAPAGYTTDLSYSVAAAYTMGNYKVALGYERLDVAAGGTNWTVDQISVGGDATFGAVVVKARYATGGNEGDNGFTQDNDQWAVSGTYTANALALTAFVSDGDLSQSGVTVAEREAYGLGAAYDLGGGAKVVGGYVRNQSTDEDAFDLGVSFTF